MSYSVSGGGSPTAPTLTAKQFGSSYTPSLTGTATTYWLDSGQSWSVTNPLGGSGSSERWDSGQTVSGTVSASSPTTAGGTLTFTYYNQYSITFGYGDQDSSAITSSSQIGSYYQFGSSSGTILAGSSYGLTSPVSDWVDAGSAKVSYQTYTSGGQRWALSSSPASFTVSSSTTISDSSFYHQYSITFGYGDQDSSAVTSSSKIGSYYQFGSSTAGTINSGSSYGATSPASNWVDAGTAKVSYQTFTAGSGTERWALSSSPDNRAVSSSTTISESAYYHQYLMTLSYSVTGGSGYSAPSFSANAFGASAPQTLTTTATGYWFDAGASWTVTNPLGGGSATYRWYTTQSTSGTVSAQTIAFVYNYQVFGIDTNCIGFGSESSSGSIPVTTSSMTAQANELIIVVVTSGHSGSSSTRTFTITDSFGDTYTQRGSTVTSGSNAEQISEYYANTGSHTGSFTVTATDSSGSYNRNIDVLAFGITGAAASPFDTHAGLPYPAHNGGSSAPTVTGVSTSNAHDMILAFEGHLSSTADTVGTLAGTAFSAPSGFLNNPSNGEGCNAEYQIVSSAISSATATFGTSESNWVMIVDAVQRAW